MTRQKFNSSYDQAVADHADTAKGYTHGLMCQAHGCPNRWTVDLHGQLCSAHGWADPHDWPEITQREIWNETERIRLREDAPPASVRHVDHARLGVWLTRLADRMKRCAAEPRAWAVRLRDREAAGEKLSLVQRNAWRSELPEREPAEVELRREQTPPDLIGRAP